MKFSILINNWNYGRYLRECVESALHQVYAAHEIIVVDDGSTDDSLAILDKHFGTHPGVKIIAQHNQGHTGAIATGVENASGDIVCLLDSDDRYKPNYLSELESHYRKRPRIDLTFCRYDPFGIEPFPGQDLFLSPQTDYDYGYTALLTYFGYPNWIGNITSTLSLRINLARTLNLREVARLYYVSCQGDFPVVVGASFLGGRKYHLHQALVDYRMHGQNESWQLRLHKEPRFTHWFSDQIRYNHYRRRSGIGDDLWRHLPHEAAMIPHPSLLHMQHYEKVYALCQRRVKPEKVSLFRQGERNLRKWRKRLLGQTQVPNRFPWKQDPE